MLPPALASDPRALGCRDGRALRWKALFGSALDTVDDMSETASLASGGGVSVVSARPSVRPVAPGYAAASPVATPSVSGRESVRSVKPDGRPVSVLKPKVRWLVWLCLRCPDRVRSAFL